MKTWLIAIVVLCLAANTACHNQTTLLKFSYQQENKNTAQEKKKLTEAEAISLAEEFIKNNGYTDLPPTADRTKISHETVEFDDMETMLKNRHNTLQRKAFGVLFKGRGGSTGWTIVFQFTHDNTRTGRAVTMDLYGDKLLVEHKDIFLKAVEKKL
jgi:hypothetical protein